MHLRSTFPFDPAGAIRGSSQRPSRASPLVVRRVKSGPKQGDNSEAARLCDLPSIPNYRSFPDPTKYLVITPRRLHVVFYLVLGSRSSHS